MKNIAKAIIYASTYINMRDDSFDEQDDVGALESIAGFLANCSKEEINILGISCREMIKSEKESKFPRQSFIRDYENWMEEMGFEK